MGVGGIGMSGIAEVLLSLGHRVTGSDLRGGAQTQRLAAAGATVFRGHDSSHARGADVVVVSSAVPEDNPEVRFARDQGIPVIPRAEMLAELMRLKSSVAVAGSHGKTTTCSLLGTILTEGGWDPTLVIGGKVNNLGGNARLGQGDLLVAEADESDGSFLLLCPTVTVVTNIDREHLNYYGDLESLKETFLTFVNRVPFYGFSVLCLDDPQVRSLLSRVKKRKITYGLTPGAQATAREIQSEDWGFSFTLAFEGRDLGRLTVNIPGAHNVLNSLAASVVALELGVGFPALAAGIAKLSGVGRRLEKKGEAGGVLFLDDYGHHPTEIRATLKTLAERFPRRRKVVLFQPHRHSRTRALFEEFVGSFALADKLYVTDIYAAGEEARADLTAETLVAAIRRGGPDAEYGGRVADLPARVAPGLAPGDVALTLGAGDIYEAGEELMRLVRGERVTA